MLLLALNIVAATSAATVYGLWAAKWLNRNAPGLALLNALVALVAGGVGVVYLLLLLTGDESHTQPLRAIVSLMLLLPAIARMLELRRDERREAVAQQLEDELLGAMRHDRTDR